MRGIHDRATARPVTRGALVTAAAFGLLSLATPSPAHAQGSYEPDLNEADLETLLNTPVDVYTPTKTAQPQQEAPAIITIVTGEQISVWGHRTLAELLNHLLGFFIVDDHNTPNVAVRGISGGLYADSSIIKVLINGHSMSFASTGGNSLGPELIPLSAIERVEIIRGPASALYGADAFLGLVNIQTRDGATVNGASARVAGGRQVGNWASDVDVSAGLWRGIFDFMVAVRRNDQDLSGLELPDTSPRAKIPLYNVGQRRARGLYQKSTSAISTLTIRPRTGTEVGLFGYYAAMGRGSEFGSQMQLAYGLNRRGVLSENRVSQWQARAGLTLNQELSACLRLSLRAQYFQGGPGSDYRLEVGSEYYYVRRHFGFRGTEVDAHVVYAPLQDLSLVGGASLLIDRERLPSRIGIAKQQIGDVAPGGIVPAISVYGGRKLLLNAGAYGQATWDVFDNLLRVTGGLRYDHHNVYGAQLSRRLGLVSSPLPSLHAKLLHGRAFRAPSPLLLYAVPSAPADDVIGNASLAPQYIDTVELQVSYEAASWLTLSTDVAYNRITDKTEFIEQGIFKAARNVARATTISWENLVELKYPSWLHAHGSLELQRTRQQTGQQGYAADVVGEEGSTYPNVMVHGGAVLQPPRSPLRLAVLASYIGVRRATGNNILLNGAPYTLPAYVLLEGNLSTVGLRILRDVAQEVSFSLAGKNLLDAKGPTPGFAGIDYPLNPRAFFLQMNLEL